MRKLHDCLTRRMVWGLALIGGMVLASGCTEPNPATDVAPEEAKAQGNAMREAMEKNFGPSGVPTGAKDQKSASAPEKKAEPATKAEPEAKAEPEKKAE